MSIHHFIRMCRSVPGTNHFFSCHFTTSAAFCVYISPWRTIFTGISIFTTLYFDCNQQILPVRSRRKEIVVASKLDTTSTGRTNKINRKPKRDSVESWINLGSLGCNLAACSNKHTVFLFRFDIPPIFTITNRTN